MATAASGARRAGTIEATARAIPVVAVMLFVGQFDLGVLGHVRRHRIHFVGLLIGQGQQRIAFRAGEAPAALFVGEEGDKEARQEQTEENRERNDGHGEEETIQLPTWNRSALIGCYRAFIGGLRNICAMISNGRRATHLQFWQSAGMEFDLVARFAELRPAIRKNWSARLEQAPPAPAMASGLITPAMLVFMLDDTLDLLAKRLKTKRGPRRTPRDLTAFSAMRGGCRCGLHLLLNYYLVGALVLRELLPKELQAGRVTVMGEFNELAHAEMSALCGVCLHRGGTLCSLEERAKKFAQPT